MSQLNTERSGNGSLNFSLPEFFDGDTKARGFFETPFGTVKKTFLAEIRGYWKDEHFCLDERFDFSDGSTEKRTWLLTPLNETTFIANCDDIVSPALVKQSGNTATMSYKIGLNIADKKINMRFSDLFVMVSERVVLNRANVSKWGLPVGRLVTSFYKNFES